MTMRFLTTVLLVLPFAAFSQTENTDRPVLKALPLDFEDQPPQPAITVRPALPPQAPEAAALPIPTPAPMPIPATAADPTASIDEKPTGDDAVRLQIFLDQSNFGPGVIDGKIGRFSELAVRSWNENQGHPIESWRAANIAARAAVPNPYAVAIVPEAAEKWVNPGLSHKRPEQAKAKQMSYRSIGEFMSERYHTDVPYLISLNSASKINNLKPRDTIIVPNVKAFEVELLTDRSYSELEDLGERYAVVDTKNNQVRIFAAAPRPNIISDPGLSSAPLPNKALLASFPITPGKPQFVELGSWKLKNMVELPWWRYDQQLLDTGKRSENALMIPPGPNSPVGIIWNGTTRPGIGLHGTSDPETIGRSQSAGCIRLANWDAIRLPTLIRPGATIEIR
ncbi:L,D-transpeptidase family protein [Akkermansiaceae bacterium]|nr:L,D-transpeptidase family protein [Akkermansiaceae bacterium]